jgi:hypothetical protein
MAFYVDDLTKRKQPISALGPAETEHNGAAFSAYRAAFML